MINCALLTILVSSCTALPERSYDVKLWLIDWKSGCVSRLVEDKKIVKCSNDPDFPFLIGISPEDYKKERDYQDKLKQVCQ